MRLLACLSVIALLGSGADANAQDVTGGVKGGVNFATLNFDPDPEVDFDSRTGIVVGGFVTFPVGAHFAVQPEVLYSQKGAQSTFLGADVKIKIDYVETPILLKYSTSGSGGTSFYVFGGPSLGFKVAAESTASFSGETEEDDISEDIKSFDVGVVFGAGVQLGRFSVDGRYTLGFTNISEEDVDEMKATNRAVAILAGLRF
jgi:hypothetical protein